MKYSTWDKLYLIGLSSGLVLSAFVILLLTAVSKLVIDGTNQGSNSQTIVVPTEVESKKKVPPFVIEKPLVKVLPQPTPVVKQPAPVVKVIPETQPAVKDSVVITQDTTK